MWQFLFLPLWCLSFTGFILRSLIAACSKDKCRFGCSVICFTFFKSRKYIYIYIYSGVSQYFNFSKLMPIRQPVFSSVLCQTINQLRLATFFRLLIFFYLHFKKNNSVIKELDGF